MTELFLCFFVVFILLNAVDAITTAYILHHKIGREANPIMAFLIKHLELPLGLLAPKIAAAILVYAFLGDWEYSSWAMIPICLLYVWVCFNNASVILRWQMYGEKSRG